MTHHRKKLIEVALPLEAINKASVRESYIYKGNPSSVHKWWAQRPLAAARAVIFASLVDDPNDPNAPVDYVEACRQLPRGKNAAEVDTPRQRLFDFIEELVKWESTTDDDILSIARKLILLSTKGMPPPLLDPFAGGGSIPLEAQRLGLEAYASDLNPIATILNRALLEFSSLFANRSPINPRDGIEKAQGIEWSGLSGLATDLLYYGRWVRDMAWEKIGHLYPSGPNGHTIIAWLWARTVKSPNPALDVRTPLVRSFWVSKRKGQKAWIEPQIDPDTKEVSFQVKKGEGTAPPGTVNRSGGRCLVSGSPMPFEYIRSEGQAGRIRTEMMAIVTDEPGGRQAYTPNDIQIQAANSAEPDWRPEYPLPENPRDFKPPNYGMTTFADLFTTRQLVALNTFVELVGEVQRVIRQDAINTGMIEGTSLRDGGQGAQAYAEAIVTYLAFAYDKYAMYGNAFVPWYAKEIRPSMLFTRQAIPMVWDFVEVNPFTDIGGSFIRSVEIIADAIGSLPTIQAGHAFQSDAATKAGFEWCEDLLISTDPPYYDNIGYACLSDFFYVWLRRGLKDIYPAELSTLLVPKEAELVATPYRFDGDTDAANQHFEAGLYGAFVNMRNRVSFNYPFTVYYAFKQADIVINDSDGNGEIVSSTGWETMLESLIKAGFTIEGTWPIRTERGGRMISYKSNALASSIVLVCRPRPDDAPMTSRRDFVNTLRNELPPALREMQSGNIAPVDLAQASIGPGMAVYSRYRKVLEPNGDPLTVRTALQLINQVLDEYLTEQEGDLDPASRFAVAWFQQHGFDAGDFGTADVLARAKNTSVDALARAGFLESGAGKVRLLTWDELDPGRLGSRASGPPHADETSAILNITVWEAVHYLVERLNTHGEQGAAMLLARMPSDLAAAARQLAYRLYSLCERQGWADHARDYNALVVSWGASQEQARTFKEQLQQGTLFDS